MRGNLVSIDRSLVENLLSALDEGGLPPGAQLAQSIAELETLLRSIRRSYFPKAYFSDGLWDILLELHKASGQGGGIAITNIGFEVGVPLATTLRYIKRLEQDGYVLREADRHDKRRFFISLTKAGKALMDDIFEDTASTFQTRNAAGKTARRPMEKSVHRAHGEGGEAAPVWIGNPVGLSHR